jgi:beta-phosphoglucomutase-like phosphatase (HAD superfamily)
MGTMMTTASSLASRCIRSVVGPGIGLGQISKPIALLRLAEVERVEQLFQADDLPRRVRPALRTSLLGAGHVGRDVRACVVLDDADRKRLLAMCTRE